MLKHKFDSHPDYHFMKTFKEYLYESNRLLESPQLVGNELNVIDSLGGSNVLATKARSQGKNVDSILYKKEVVECWRVIRDDFYVDVWVPKEGDIAYAYISYEIYDGGILEKAIEQSVATPGFARFLYENFYLAKFRFIESDIAHTVRGMFMWEKVVYDLSLKGYKITYLDSSNQEHELKPEEIKSLYISTLENRETRIRIYRK